MPVGFHAFRRLAHGRREQSTRRTSSLGAVPFPLGGIRMRIHVNREQSAEFCRRHHIRRLAFFGSVLRDDFRPDSDVDVLIEFEPEYRLGLFELMRMQQEFSDLIGREADFRTPEDLGRYMRNRVVSEAEVQYAA